MKDKKINQEFLELIVKLEAAEFLGVCAILSVSFVDKEKKDRDFESIFSEVLEKFLKLNRKQKRNLLKILRRSINGTHTKNSKD